jgi:hypothetical protein
MVTYRWSRRDGGDGKVLRVAGREECSDDRENFTASCSGVWEALYDLRMNFAEETATEEMFGKVVRIKC